MTKLSLKRALKSAWMVFSLNELDFPSCQRISIDYPAMTQAPLKMCNRESILPALLVCLLSALLVLMSSCSPAGDENEEQKEDSRDKTTGEIEEGDTAEAPVETGAAEAADTSESEGTEAETESTVATVEDPAEAEEEEEVTAASLIDPSLPEYEASGSLSGLINSFGSDTMTNLMTFWREGFERFHPNLTIQVQGAGSGTAPPALIEGTGQLGPMSRLMKEEEIFAFEQKFGYQPTAVPVGVDALAIFVHKDNPMEGITMAQADSVFSSSRRREGPEVTTWGDLALTGRFANRELTIYGRNPTSGTYAFFKELVLRGGDYKDSVTSQPGSSSVVQSVAADLYAIGYSGIGYKTSGVKALPVGETMDNLYEPTAANCLSGDYPVARLLYIYVNKKPGEALDPRVKEFLRYVLSKEGQEIVVKDGYYPLPKVIVEDSLGRLRE